MIPFSFVRRIHNNMPPRIRGEDDGVTTQRKRRRRGQSDSDNEETPVAGPSSRQQASTAPARPIDDHRLKRIRGEAEGDVKPVEAEVDPLPPAESTSAVSSDPPPPRPPSPMDADAEPHETFGPLEEKKRVAPQVGFQC
jgi:hypothetical protein